MLSSNSLASITTSSGAGPKPDETGEPRRTATAFATRAPVGARPAAGRYGDDRRPNLPAAALTLALSAALLAALVHTGYQRAQTEAAKLAVVNLSVAPPPPPPAPPKEVSQQQPAPIVAPRPLVVVPNDRPPLLVSPDPVPVLPVPVALPLAPPAPPAPPATVRADDLGTRMLSGAPPSYPRESRRHHEEGTVVLALTLDTDGSVTAISVARSSGFQRLDDAALRAVRKWRWAPTTRNGQAVKVKGLVEIPFILRGKGS